MQKVTDHRTKVGCWYWRWTNLEMLICKSLYNWGWVIFLFFFRDLRLSFKKYHAEHYLPSHNSKSVLKVLGHHGRFGCIGKKYWYHKWHDTSLISKDRKTVLISQLYLLNHCRLPEADSIACVEELLGSLNCLWMILPFQDKVEPRYSSFTEVCRPSWKQPAKLGCATHSVQIFTTDHITNSIAD